MCSCHSSVNRKSVTVRTMKPASLWLAPRRHSGNATLHNVSIAAISNSSTPQRQLLAIHTSSRECSPWAMAIVRAGAAEPGAVHCINTSRGLTCSPRTHQRANSVTLTTVLTNNTCCFKVPSHHYIRQHQTQMVLYACRLLPLDHKGGMRQPTLSVLHSHTTPWHHQSTMV